MNFSFVSMIVGWCVLIGVGSAVRADDDKPQPAA